MAPPMSSASTRGMRFWMTSSLSDTFAPPENRDERMLGMFQHPPQVFDLGGHEQAGGGLLDVPDHALGRRVRPVRRTERVIHIDVRQRRQLAGKRRIVLLFLRVEPQVLEQDDAAIRRTVDGRLGRLADAVLRERDRAVQQRRQPFGHRLQRVLRIGLSLRPPEVRAQDHRPRPVLQRVLDRRQRRADPRVVPDRAVLDRHVEVHADQHAPPLEVEILDRLFLCHAFVDP